jgi:hypothetical protein
MDIQGADTFDGVCALMGRLRGSTTRYSELMKDGDPYYALCFRLVADPLADVFAPLDSTTPEEWEFALGFLLSDWAQLLAMYIDIPQGVLRELLMRYRDELRERWRAISARKE